MRHSDSSPAVMPVRPETLLSSAVRKVLRPQHRALVAPAKERVLLDLQRKS